MNMLSGVCSTIMNTTAMVKALCLTMVLRQTSRSRKRTSRLGFLLPFFIAGWLFPRSLFRRYWLSCRHGSTFVIWALSATDHPERTTLPASLSLLSLHPYTLEWLVWTGQATTWCQAMVPAAVSRGKRCIHWTSESISVLRQPL